MKLHVKLLLYLLCSVMVVVTIAQVLQYIDTTKRLERVTSDQIEVLAAREEASAENVYHSIEQSVAGSLQRGEMHKFTELLADQKNVDGLMEYSLFDRHGKVTHSSHEEFLGRDISAERKDKVFGTTEKLIVQTDESIEIYQPTVNEGDCFRCHTDWEPGSICGVTYFKFSTAELAKSKAEAVETIASAKKISLRNGIITVFGVVIALAATMFIVVKKYVQDPLSTAILEGKFPEGSTIKGDVAKGGLSFS
jgi:methyl-accepting chemotaxis protein